MFTPDLNSIRPCSVKMCGSHKFYDVNVEKLAANSALQLQRRKYKIAYKALYTRARECRAAPSKLLNVATRYTRPHAKEMSRCFLTISGLWGPLFVRAPVRLDMLNMLKSGSVNS